MRKEFNLSTPDNQKLDITTYGNLSEFNGCAIIYVHGFKGFKDWGFVPYLGNYFANQKYYVITFNFSHNGIGDDPLEFTEVERFAKNTISREVDELNYLIESVKNGFFNNVNFNKIFLLGHSRGGAVSILSAFNNNYVDALATWASISKLDRFSERQKKEWKEKGFFEVVNTRTKQVMKLNYSLIEDIQKNSKNKLNIENSVSNLNKPFLIVHGNQDLAVPIEEGKSIYGWANKDKTEFLEVPAAGHTFDIKHPFESSNGKFNLVLEKTRTFFDNQL